MTLSLPPSPLFEGMSPQETQSVLQCLQAAPRKVAKDEYLFWEGEALSWAGLVLEGRIQLIREDLWGNRRLLRTVEPGELFGESYACAPEALSMVSAQAVMPSRILTLDITHLLTTCSSACPFHTRLIRNLLTILSEKNLFLTQKLEHLTQRTTREKVLSYLQALSRQQHSLTVTVPYNRQQLADYLSVERSALSAELSRMAGEGLLDYRKNIFTLQRPRE